MSEHDDDKAELEAARNAVRTAQIDSVKADTMVALIHQTSAEIQTITERNGYLERFRRVIRGAA